MIRVVKNWAAAFLFICATSNASKSTPKSFRMCGFHMYTSALVLLLLLLSAHLLTSSQPPLPSAPSNVVMALVVASLGWMFTARTVRAQVLSIREKAYVEVARVNGEGPWEILFREVMPNIMPYIVASFVGTVSGSILAVIGLEALGLGALEEMTLGNTIYWSQQSSAVLRGYWWWWGPPIVMIALIFIGLFLTSVGFDRFANPRLATTPSRRQTSASPSTSHIAWARATSKPTARSTAAKSCASTSRATTSTSTTSGPRRWARAGPRA